MPSTILTLENLIEYLRNSNAEAPVLVSELLQHFQIPNLKAPLYIDDQTKIPFDQFLNHYYIVNGPGLQYAVDRTIQLTVKNHGYMAIAILAKFMATHQCSANDLFIDDNVPKVLTHGKLWQVITNTFH